jgi:hypothetical protein
MSETLQMRYDIYVAQSTACGDTNIKTFDEWLNT